MKFSINKFMDAKWERRTEFFEFPELRDFFDLKKDEAPGFWIQNLEGLEIAEIESRKDLSDLAASMLRSFGAMIPDEIQSSLQKYIERVKNEQTDRRIVIIKYGVQKPKIDERTAAHINRLFPIKAKILADRIAKMTDLGSVPGKPPGSSKTQKSEQPCNSES
jgi:hypothetical protein